MNEFVIHLGPNSLVEFEADHEESNCSATHADTGPFTMTGDRAKRVERHRKGRFTVTQCDG